MILSIFNEVGDVMRGGRGEDEEMYIGVIDEGGEGVQVRQVEQVA